MKNAFLYITTVFIWGSTWLAIEYQLGEVEIIVSLIYRFGLAGIIVLLLCGMTNTWQRFSLKQHGFITLLGLLNFCLNYVTLYHAQLYLTSAITSIVFSILLLMNILNTRIFFRKKIPLKTYVGAIIGVGGIVVLFWPEVVEYRPQENTLLGLLLVISGALFASLGNMVSVRNSNKNLPVFQTSGLGMLYGTLFMTIYALFNGSNFTIASTQNYWLSFAYLTIFGTIIAFYSYFLLLKNIGPEKTSYSIVLFPVVAVILSGLFENFEWTAYTFVGFVLVGLGNLIVLVPKSKLKRLTESLVSNSTCENMSVNECIESVRIKQLS